MDNKSGRRNPGLKAAVALLGAIALVGAVGGVAAARSSNPLNLEVSPGVQLVNLGGTATYTISLDQSRHFGGTAALSVISGLPKHSSAVFSSATIAGTQQVTLSVRTNSSTPRGIDNIRIRAKAPNNTDTVTAQLYVVLIPLSVSATPSSDTINAGQSAGYNVTIRHGRWDPTVKVTASGLPSGATASFSPSSTKGATSHLTISTTAAGTPSGDYPITIVASTPLRSAHTQVVLHVGPTAMPFTINGSLNPPLYPGTGGGIDVSVTNPNSGPITVSGLVATVSSITAPKATVANPCTVADFAGVAQIGSVVVPASSTATLSSLGVPAIDWPEFNMTDTASSQDGCQGATLGLTWAGTAHGGI